MPKSVHHHLKNAILFVIVFAAMLYILLLASSLRMYAVREVNTPQSQARPQGKFIKVDEANVYYEYSRSKNSPPKATLILLHGFGASLTTWDDQLPYLQTDYDVLAVDMLGFGLSQDIGNSVLGPEAQARMLEGLMRQLAIAHAYFIGNSMGGGVAQRMALNLPDKVDGLILIDSVDLSDFAGYASLSWANSPLLAEIPANILINHDNFRSILESAFGDPAKVTEELVAKHYQSFTIKGSGHNLLAQAFVRPNDRLVETGHITQPVLIIRGSLDTWVSQTMTNHLKDGLPNREYAEIPGAGHIPQEEDPAIVNQLLGNWLARTVK